MATQFRGNVRRAILATLPARPAQVTALFALDPARLARHRKTNARNNALLRSIAGDGFALVPGYLSPLACQVAIGEFNRALAEFPGLIHVTEDERLYGIECASEIALRFQSDPLWINLAKAYTHRTQETVTTMANKVSRPGTDGSGGCWHRDGFARELKVIVYLSDVTEDNGPFQIVRGSHRTRAFLSDMNTGGIGPMQNRVGSEAVGRLLDRDPTRLVSFTAERGTAIVFDDSCIHRGAPLKSGTRYALTHYISGRNIAAKARALYEPALHQATS